MVLHIAVHFSGEVRRAHIEGMANPDQPRHVAGTPKSQGGQYRPVQLNERTEPIELSDAAHQSPAAWWQAAATMLNDAADQRFVQLAVPPMGDRIEPPRRYPRIRYGGDEVELRMPSVTRIRSSLDGSPDSVGVQVPLGYTLAGESGMATARIERTPSGRWFARVDGVDAHTNAVLSEAIASAVESRHPRMVPHDIETLLARRRQRVAAVGSESRPVATSFIEAVAYDDSTGVLAMQLARSSHAHGYVVSRKVYEEMLSASDPGAAYNSLVKGRPKSYAERCDQCGRFTFSKSDGGHTCPPSALLDHVPAQRHRQAEERPEPPNPPQHAVAPAVEDTAPASAPETDEWDLPATSATEAPATDIQVAVQSDSWDIPEDPPQPAVPAEDWSSPPPAIATQSDDPEYPDPWPGEPPVLRADNPPPPDWWGSDPNHMGDDVKFPEAWTNPHAAIFGQTTATTDTTTQRSGTIHPGRERYRSEPNRISRKQSWLRKGVGGILRGIGVALRSVFR